MGTVSQLAGIPDVPGKAGQLSRIAFGGEDSQEGADAVAILGGVTEQGRLRVR